MAETEPRNIDCHVSSFQDSCHHFRGGALSRGGGGYARKNSSRSKRREPAPNTESLDSGRCQYLGYVIRILYDDKLQTVRADPQRLINDAPILPFAVTQLLVVHRDPEIRRDLVQLVKDYTGYESLLTHSESETLFWLRRQPEVRPQILLTQLQAPGLDGFILGASLGEMFPGLQTLFLPAYAASVQRHGSGRLESFSGTNRRGTTNRHDRAIMRMFSGAPIFSAFLISCRCAAFPAAAAPCKWFRARTSARSYLRDGQIVHADAGTECGNDALVEIVSCGGKSNLPTTVPPPPVLKQLVRHGMHCSSMRWKKENVRALRAWRQQTG